MSYKQLLNIGNHYRHGWDKPFHIYHFQTFISVDKYHQFFGRMLLGLVFRVL